jgi:transposase
MSMRPNPGEHVPEETARIAQRAFPNGHPYLRMRDAFGALFTNELFAALFHHHGRPAEAPARLALVSILQFAEGLSDRQAADAVRSRLDWKYLLGLELTDPGFDHTVLVEFRQRLVQGDQEGLLFEQLLEHFRACGWLKARGTQRTDATHVLAAVRGLNRLEAVGETMRHALNTLASAAPTWLLPQLDPAWTERYERSFEETRLPKSDRERQALAERIGGDGFRLLRAIAAEAAAGTEWAWLREVPAVEILRQVWVQQFYRETAPAVSGTLRWRGEDEFPPAALAIHSPYDAEARWGRKGGLGWAGYKVHLTESCDPDTPHLITDVQTTPATTADTAVVPAVQDALAARDLTPTTHLVDGGYIDAELLVASQERQIDLCGPTRGNSHWQAKEGGFTAADFQIEWNARQATCPGGRPSRRWNEGRDAWGNPLIAISFARSDCQACALRPQCTRAQENGRVLSVRPQAQHTALMAARQREGTEAFRYVYAARAGIEGTVSQGVRRSNLRHCRYVGLAKLKLQHFLTAAGINLVRAAAWLTEPSLARTRQSAFIRLATQAG